MVDSVVAGNVERQTLEQTSVFDFKAMGLESRDCFGGRVDQAADIAEILNGSDAYDRQ